MTTPEEPLFLRLLAASPFSTRELLTLIHTAPFRYKEHFIEKRHGKGKRLISQPTAELKFLQRWLVRDELSNLPIHPAAKAYRKDTSIADYAAPHAKNRYLLKLDFKDFFPSLGSDSIIYRLSRDRNYTDVELSILIHLLCKGVERGLDRYQLAIGAPSSPFLSNYLLHEFDAKLTEICDRHDAIYGRYADDLAISTSLPARLDVIEEEVRQSLREFDYLHLTLNETKTVNVSRKHKRVLTGLTLTNAGSVSVGHDEKRRLRVAAHRYSHGLLSPEEQGQLRGKLAFILSFDEQFVATVCAKYGITGIGDSKQNK